MVTCALGHCFTQCSVYQINIKVDFVILSCHVTLFMVVACVKFDSVACYIDGGGVSILSSARYQIIRSTSIQSHPISITRYVAPTQCSSGHRGTLSEVFQRMFDVANVACHVNVEV